MQTFLCYPNFKQSASVLDNRRLGKQRVECLQILKTLAKGPTQYICHRCNNNWISHYPNCGCGDSFTETRKTPWYNHPAVQMWKNHVPNLAFYGLICCIEWQRGFKDTCYKKIDKFLSAKYYVFPKWLSDPRFCASHRSNLLRKDPKHYGRFGLSEPPDLEYFWPTKHGY